VFRANYDYSIVASDLKNITFANHDLMTDSVFRGMQLILCGNVLIYFDYTLQERVYKIFTVSLFYQGFLCLGSNESMGFSEVCDYFKVVDGTQKICQKIVRRQLGVGDKKVGARLVESICMEIFKDYQSSVHFSW